MVDSCTGVEYKDDYYFEQCGTGNTFWLWIAFILFILANAFDRFLWCVLSAS